MKKTYNGKELQDELGLNWHDYGARNYDASLGRWMNIDPLAEKYYEYSAYNYTLNNPVFFIDPNGESVDVTDIAGSDDEDDEWLLFQLMVDLAYISGQKITKTENSEGKTLLEGSGACGSKCTEGNAYITHLLDH